MALSRSLSNYWNQLKSRAISAVVVLSSVILMFTYAYYQPGIYPALTAVAVSVVITAKMYKDFTQMVQNQAVHERATFRIPSSYNIKLASVIIVSIMLALITNIDDIVVAGFSATGTGFLSVTVFGVLQINAIFWLVVRFFVQDNWIKIKKNHYSKRGKVNHTLSQISGS